MFAGEKILVLGGALSGQSAYSTLKSLGACPIMVADTAKREAVGLDGIKLCVISPGVPTDDYYAVMCRRSGIKVVSELELGYLLTRGKIAAVTGTNGKTTTVMLLAEMLKASGITTAALGNVGKPLSGSTLFFDESAVLSVEVSSFMLENTHQFAPHIAAVLNITPDHLDRHKTMDNYIDIKLKIFAAQTTGDFAVINADDPLLRGVKTQAQREYISVYDEVEGGYLKGGRLMYHSASLVTLNELALRGIHNVYNALTAAVCALCAGADIEAVRQTLRTFKGVRHRLQDVCSDGEVSFVNDSKATNPDAAIRGIKSIPAPVVVILGGSDKGADFTELFRQMPDNVVKAVVCGASADKLLIAAAEVKYGRVQYVKGFSAAVEEAYKIAKALAQKCVVLLSPACASFDEFSNFEHRGDTFCQIANSLCGGMMPQAGSEWGGR